MIGPDLYAFETLWRHYRQCRRNKHDSYACRTGKGTLAASDRLMTFLRQITANGRRPAWALKLDVANFFPSIHKATLDDILACQIIHPELRWLTRTLLFHDPTTNYRFQSCTPGVPGPDSPYYPVPPPKSLFGKRNERGLPIGNLTSQFWGNVYMHDVDQFVKRTLQCRHYLRYVDDMVLLAPVTTAWSSSRVDDSSSFTARGALPPRRPWGYTPCSSPVPAMRSRRGFRRGWPGGTRPERSDRA